MSAAIPMGAISARPSPQPRYQLQLSHVRQSPYAEQAEADMIAWMFAHHLPAEENRLHRVKKMEISKYAAYSQPFGDDADLLIFAKYITLWLLWDDFVIEKQADTQSLMQEMQQVFDVGMAQPISSNHYVAAWQSIVIAYLARRASMAFIRRLGRNMQHCSLNLNQSRNVGESISNIAQRASVSGRRYRRQAISAAAR